VRAARRHDNFPDDAEHENERLEHLIRFYSIIEMLNRISAARVSIIRAWTLAIRSWWIYSQLFFEGMEVRRMFWLPE
jgi:hypothetical protein